MESRQLGPIYDTLEIGDMPKAVSECDKILRKNPNHFGAQSLKAFALARQNESGKALALAQHVLKASNALTSPHVQQGLALTFQVLRMPKEEMAVYKSALKHAVSNQKIEEMLCKVFFVAARNGMYKEQHATAVDLNKRFKQEKYLWWVIISLVLESQQKSVDNSSSGSKQLQLTLAERMAEKALAEGKMDSTEELRIYLDILRLQGKQSEMAKLLTIGDGGSGSSLAQKIANDPDLITERLGLLITEGSLDEAIIQCIKTLDTRDNWADYKHYIEAVSKNQETEDSNNDQVVQSLCQNLDRWAKKHGRARGARLAFVELASRVGAVRDMGLGAWIWEYVDEFKAKVICFSDIRAYLVAHIQSSAEAISYHNTQLEQRLESARQENMSIENNSVAWLNLEKIRYLLQALTDVTDPHSWANGIDRLLKFGLDSDQATKRNAVCSDMVLLAGQRIIQTAFLAYGQKDDGYNSQLCSALFVALCVFESGIKLNGNHFMLKLYAIRLYLYLSCYDRARQLYDTLSIKNIQHDTLGYLIIGQGIALGCFSRDLELCYEAVSFYDRAKIRVTRELESSYRNGTYSNITDFIEFEDNLAKSVQHECTHRNALRGETMEQAGTKDLLEQWKLADVVSIQHTKESLAELHDNRDTQVMGQLAPAEMRKWDMERLTRPASATPSSGWIQLYSLVPQIMHFIASAELGMLKTKSDELSSVTASNVIGSFDLLFARGISYTIGLYTSAVAGNKQLVKESLSKLTNLIRQGLLGAEDLDNGVCHTLALNTIRDAAMVSELFTYALSVKQALADQKSPIANTVAGELSRVRKHALKAVGDLRKWADKEARGAIQSQWPLRNDSECPLASVVEYAIDSHGSAIEMVARNCAAGWLKSAKSLIVHWEQCS